jgi:hypothetical protein
MKPKDINEKFNVVNEEDRRKPYQDKPWRKDSIPLNKPPTNPDYPTHPFNHEEWIKSSKKMDEDSELPNVGDTIRTKKTQMDGKVEKIQNDIVFFRIEDGRLMKTPVSNVTVVQKLADEDTDVMEGPNDNFTIDDIHELERINDLPTAKARAKQLIQTQSKKKMKPEKVAYFNAMIDEKNSVMKVVKLMYDLLLSGEGQGVLGTKNSMGQSGYRKRFGEGGMGGINRCAPANDVSYEHVLDEVKAMWEKEQIDELSVDKMKAYVNKAKSTSNFKQGRSLGKIAKTAATGVPTAIDKINAKTGNRTGNSPKQGPIRQGPVREQDIVGEVNTSVQPKKEPIDPWNGNAKKLAKAPKSTMQGSEVATFDEMVKDTIEAQGLEWAFDYYVKKHGLSPRQFAIYAGLNASPPAKPRVKDDWTDPSRTRRPKKKGW